MTIKVGNDCLEGAFTQQAVLAGAYRGDLEGIEHDTLVGIGMSGALVVPLIAQAIGKNYLIVRKPHDSHHHDGGGPAEGHFGEKWVMVDDGLATGGSYRYVRQVVAELARQHGISEDFQGLWAYGDMGHFWSWSPHQLLLPDHRLLHVDVGPAELEPARYEYAART